MISKVITALLIFISSSVLADMPRNTEASVRGPDQTPPVQSLNGKQANAPLRILLAGDLPYTTTIGCKKGTRVNCSQTWSCCEKGGYCDKDGFATCN